MICNSRQAAGVLVMVILRLSVCLWSCSWWKAWTLRLHSHCRCPYSCSALASATRTQREQGLIHRVLTCTLELRTDRHPTETGPEICENWQELQCCLSKSVMFLSLLVAITPLAKDRHHLISQYETPLSPRNREQGQRPLQNLQMEPPSFPSRHHMLRQQELSKCHPLDTLFKMQQNDKNKEDNVAICERANPSKSGEQ